jgi:hypothetical protein
MKTLTTTVMSALLLAGSALAAQTAATGPAATATTAPKVKKHRHVNKVKKPVANSAAPVTNAAPVKK